MEYRDYIKSLKEEWIGKEVRYGDQDYTVIDVDYNGALLINKPSKFNDTTAVSIAHVQVKNAPACCGQCKNCTGGWCGVMGDSVGHNTVACEDFEER